MISYMYVVVEISGTFFVTNTMLTYNLQYCGKTALKEEEQRLYAELCAGLLPYIQDQLTLYTCDSLLLM